MLVEGLFDLLSTEASITAVLGSGKVWAGSSPEVAPLPHIVYSQVSGDGNPGLDGPEDLYQVRFQFSCYGSSYLQAKRLQLTVRRFLEGFRGALSDGSEVDSTTLSFEGDSYEEAPKLYHAPIDFEFVYRDTGS